MIHEHGPHIAGLLSFALVMQIADVVHQRPWVPGMGEVLPPGSRVLVQPHDLGGDNLMVRLLPLVEEGLKSEWWYVHHTSLIPLACEPARIPSPVL